MKYLITSATGDLANIATKELVEIVGVDNVSVTVRSLDKAQSLVDLGVEIRQADYFNLESLIKAFEGIDKVLFISSGNLERRQEQHENVVKALKESNVSFVAYTSAPNATESESIIAPDHKLTETLISESGIKHAFLRNNWYLENEFLLLEAAKKGEDFKHSAGNGKVGWALKKDYAIAAARIISELAPKQEIYELGGTPITYEELGKILDLNINLINVKEKENKKILEESNLPSDLIDFTLAIQKDIKENHLNLYSNDLEKVLNQKQTPLQEILDKKQ
ncbi:NAD(P)H-binding protein [Mammaliicoccus sciuri]|uniref:NAD(P)H-binding protein n=1 Tax=Mammaliicoccus sciuri TaxID=1296 RepID=UPI002B25781E|nr:NAD(P)H-binding protein [Mammaliicoccus sciuri]WQL92686.1 NAD(P)H-binding protein [Mammaliicoccus sciuri]